MSFSFRLEDSRIRFKDSFAVSFARAVRHRAPFPA
jgi:hypothetical protein